MSTPTTLVVNELSQRAILAERMQYMKQGGGNDAKRPQAWCEYGYAEDLTFEDFLRLYERHGVAHGSVHILLDKCWQTAPQVIQGDPDDKATKLKPWEKKLNRELKRLKFFRAFKEADRMRLVGRYSGILLQVKDNKKWSEPLTSGVLQRLIPAWEGQLKPSTWDTDETSPTYGDVLTWTYSEASVNENNNDAPGRQVTLHASRVIIVGDYRTGVPFLKAGYNDCVTMEKIIGGVGESVLKNAARQLAISFAQEVDMNNVAASMGLPLKDLHTGFDDIAKGMNRGQDSVLGLQGATISPLVSTVPNPQPPFDVALQSFSASVQIPGKIIIGTQTGVLAGNADQESFSLRAQGRRESQLSDDLDNALRQLIQTKLLDAPPGDDFSICWDDLTEASPSEKATRAKVLADINTAGLGTGDRYFTVDEVRDAAGFEPDTSLPPLPETEPTDEELLGADPAAPAEPEA